MKLIKGSTKKVSGSFLALLVCLVCLMLANPIAEAWQRPLAVDVATTIVFFVGIWTLLQNRIVFRLGIIAILPAIVSRWFYMYQPEEILLYISSISTAGFMAFNAYALLVYILNQQEPQPDTIYGGICVYLLLGYLWSDLYAITELFSPGSFSFSAGELTLVSMKGELNYFSFVTLATLGYGEITPVSALARTLAILEAVIGQMFVAVFIARLVGFHFIASGKSRSKK